MKKILTGTIALAVMLGVSSCSSDKASKDSSTEATSSATGDSSSDATVGSEATLQEQAIALSLDNPPAGVTIDEACFTAAFAGLSDADAQLILDGGPTGNPTLSPEGQAMGAAASACASVTATT
jgi:hypothetical protein